MADQNPEAVVPAPPATPEQQLEVLRADLKRLERREDGSAEYMRGLGEEYRRTWLQSVALGFGRHNCSEFLGMSERTWDRREKVAKSQHIRVHRV